MDVKLFWQKSMGGRKLEAGGLVSRLAASGVTEAVEAPRRNSR